MKIESKIHKIENSDEYVYNFISDFRNFKDLIPQEKVSDWNATSDKAEFSLEGIGKVGLQIAEKQPYKLVKISNQETVPFDFFLWIQLKKVEENDTRVKITIKADFNPIVKEKKKKPLQQFADTLAEQMSVYFSNRTI